MAGPWEKYAAANAEAPAAKPWEKYAQPAPEPGLLSQAGGALLSGASKLGDVADQVLGAPPRAALSELMKSGSPVEAIKAGADQLNPFSDGPKAPSSREVAAQAGLSERNLNEPSEAVKKYMDPKWVEKMAISPRDIGEIGVSTGADLSNVVPLGKIGQAAGKVADVVGGAAGKAATKGLATVSGIPEQAIKTYAADTKGINKLIKESGGDIAEASDSVRAGFTRQIEGKKRTLNNQTKQILATASDKRASAVPILNRLEEIKATIDPNLRPEVIREITKEQEKIVKMLGGFEGTPDQLNEIKKYLQEQAEASYGKDGYIFAGGDKYEKAMNQAAREARKEVVKAVPEIAGVNSQYEKLFSLQRKMNKNLIKEGSPHSALLSAGSGGNRNQKNLSRLSEIIGGDFVGDAQRLSSAQEFANPGWLPSDVTGKSATRLAMGALPGFAMGGPIGAAIGGAATSPAAVKQLINLYSAGKAPASGLKNLRGKVPISNKEIEALVRAAYMGNKNE